MEKLLAIDVPVYVEKRISGEEPLLYDLTQIDLNALENIFEQDAGSYEEEYKNEIFKWFLDNLDVKLTASFLDKEFSFPLDKKGEHTEDKRQQVQEGFLDKRGQGSEAKKRCS